MSDLDESFYDSFDSGSDSDRADGPAEENFLHMTNLRAQTAFHGIGGGASLEIPAVRKDLLLLAGNGERGGQSDSLSDQDDWR